MSDSHSCVICNNTEHNKAYQVREMMLGLKDEHEYFQCAACSCLQITHVPENLPEYYPDDSYYSYDEPNLPNGLKGQLIRQRNHYAITGQGLLGKVMQQLQPHPKLPALRPLELQAQDRVLDVGCGAGTLLYELYEAGFTEVQGIDPFITQDVEYSNGLKLHKKSIHEMDDDVRWDVIMFNHAFEHLPDQHETMEKAKSLLSEEGTIVIRVPTVSSWAWEHYGVDWCQLDAPRHLFLHSLQSMKSLADQHDMRISDIDYDSFAFQFWGSEQYQQGISLQDERSYAVNPSKSIFTAKQMKDYDKRSIALNAAKAGDQAIFYIHHQHIDG